MLTFSTFHYVGLMFLVVVKVMVSELNVIKTLSFQVDEIITRESVFNHCLTDFRDTSFMAELYIVANPLNFIIIHADVRTVNQISKKFLSLRVDI